MVRLFSVAKGRTRRPWAKEYVPRPWVWVFLACSGWGIREVDRGGLELLSYVAGRRIRRVDLKVLGSRCWDGKLCGRAVVREVDLATLARSCQDMRCVSPSWWLLDGGDGRGQGTRLTMLTRELCTNCYL